MREPWCHASYNDSGSTQLGYGLVCSLVLLDMARNYSTRYYLHSEILCFGRGLYFSTFKRQPLELPTSGRAEQYVAFRCIHLLFHTVPLRPPETGFAMPQLVPTKNLQVI